MANLSHPFGHSFNGSPIVVRDQQGKIRRIINLTLKPYEDFDLLRIKTINNNSFDATYRFDNPKAFNLITVMVGYGLIDVIYYKNNIEVKRDSHDLYKGERSLSEFDPEIREFEAIKNYVIKNMDIFDGSEEEKANHTKQLHSCSYDPRAKIYVMTRIKTLINQTESARKISSDKLDFYADQIFGDSYGLRPIQELDEDPEVGEIMVNAKDFPKWQCQVYYIKHQTKYKYDKVFENVDQLESVLNRIIAFDGKTLNRVNNSIVEAVRPTGDRVNIVIPDASDNYSLNIRKFTNFIPDKNGMRKSGTVNDEIEKLLKVLVRGKANIGVGGMMGTGKTTFINYMLTFTPQDERKTIIAQVAETDTEGVWAGHDLLVFKVNEEKNITFSKLLRTSLRTTSDRVIIPESRGAEFKELYEANTKTKGNMFTAHATDDESFMDVCVDMYMSSPDAANENAKNVKDKISKAIDIVIIMVRIGNMIRIKSISEVVLDENGFYKKVSPLIKWKRDPEDITKGCYRIEGNKITNALKDRLNELGVKASEIDEVNKMLSVRRDLI